MNTIQILIDIVIIVWLLTIEKRLKLIDKAFYAIGLVITRLYQEIFGEKENKSDE